MHRQTAQANDIIELMSYTALSAVHSYGQPKAWRLSASLHRLLYVWWVPWRENLILQSNFLKANCFDVLSKEEGVHPLLLCFFFFFTSCSLIQWWIFKYYCDLFIAAQCSASQSYFQVDIFAGRRGGGGGGVYRHVHGEVSCLTLWQRSVVAVAAAATRCLGEHLSVVWRVRWHFLVLPPSGGEGARAGLVSSTSCYKFTEVSLFVFEGWGEKGRVVYVMGSVAGGNMAACWHFPALFLLHLSAVNMKTMATWPDLASHSAECWSGSYFKSLTGMLCSSSSWS